MADKLSKEIYMWENMIDELDVRALLTWADKAAALEQWVERDRIEMRILWDVLKQNDDMEKQALVLVAALAPLD